jgi:hypothetical protein
VRSCGRAAILPPVRARLSSWLRRVDRLALATGLAAAVPVVVSTIRAADAGWLPVGDDAVIAIRSLDVLSTHPPLVGLPSSSASLIGEPVQAAGPMLFWLLALPARAGRLAPTLAIGAVNTAAVVATVALARRRGGAPLMLATALGLALVSRSLGAEPLHDVWNAYAGLLPFALLAFLAWSVAAGDHRVLPVAVVVASFVAQLELPFLPPAAALAAVTIGFVLVARDAVPRRTIAIAVALAAVCWALPLAEEVAHRPGNLERIARVGSVDAKRFGARPGWRAVEHAVGVPPWWLQRPRRDTEHLAEVGYPATTLRTLTAIAVLAGLAAVLVLAARRRRRDLIAAPALALTLCGTLGLVTARTPTEHGLFTTVAYTLLSGSVVGLFAWLALAWAAVSLVRPLPRLERLRPVGAVAAVSVVAAIGALVAANGEGDRIARGYGPLAGALDRVRDAVRPGPAVALEGRALGGTSGSVVGFDAVSAVAYELRRSGVTFVTDDVVGIGHRYDPAARRYTRTVRVAEVGRRASVPGRELARVPVRDLARGPIPPARAARSVVVTLLP